MKTTFRLAIPTLALCAMMTAFPGSGRAEEATKAAAPTPASVEGAAVQPSESVPTSPALVFETTSRNLGEINDGDKVLAEFPFKNTTDRVINITKVQPSCGCTTASNNPTSVAAGQTETIRVEFDSHGRLGKNTKSITVFTDDPVTPEYRLTFEVNVIAEIFMPKRVLDFGVVSVGDPVSQRFSVVSNLEKPLAFKKIEPSDPALTVTQVGERTRTKQEGGGTEYEFEVSAPKGLPQGDFNGRVSIETDNEKNPNQYLSLRANVVGDFAFSPARLALITEKGQMISRNITVTSRKGSAFTVVGVTHDVALPIKFETTMNEAKTEATVTAEIDATNVEPRSYTGRATITIADTNGTQSSMLVPIIASIRGQRPTAVPSTASRLPVQGPAAPPTAHQ
ncbi:DUF1573 domain-containing protein [bacterium]|nr:DUF1573 domain-containing protein [bacterium]